VEFVNQFVVPADIDHAWRLLTDVPRIAPCLPGATVRPLDDGQFEGTVAVKVGPIKVSYGGVASFQELNEQNRTMVLDARGKEASGKGSAAAVVHVDLTEQSAGSTLVRVVTDLQVTGKVAQFGRSAMADVGERLVGQFAANLQSLLDTGAGDGSPAAAAGPAPTHGGEPADSRGGAGQVAAVGADLNVLSLAAPLLKRAAPAGMTLVLGVLFGLLLGRGRDRGRDLRCGGSASAQIGHLRPADLAELAALLR
jgi:carbon monoxide dehydrogenase subunit G